MPDDLAAGRHAADHGEDQAAQRIGALLLVGGQKLEAEQRLDLVDRHAGIGDVGVVAGIADHAFGRVVLVGDVADDDLDQVLDGDEAVGATILVDHDGHVHVCRLHLHEKIGGAHGGRNEKKLAHQT